MSDHPTTMPGFATPEDIGDYLENMDYGVQARIFNRYAQKCGERSAVDGKAKRIVLSSISESVRGLAFALRDALEHLASIRPRKKAA